MENENNIEKTTSETKSACLPSYTPIEYSVGKYVMDDIIEYLEFIVSPTVEYNPKIEIVQQRVIYECQIRANVILKHLKEKYRGV